MSVQWKAVGIGLVFVLVGIAVGGAVGYTEYQNYQVRDEIQEATAEFSHGTVERDRQYRNDRWVTVYHARTTYEYTVDGTRYEGVQSATYQSQTRAERAVERFTVGDPLTVYYHPDSPAERTTSPPGGDLVGVVLAAGIGGVFLVGGFRTVRQGIRGEANLR